MCVNVFRWRGNRACGVSGDNNKRAFVCSGVVIKINDIIGCYPIYSVHVRVTKFALSAFYVHSPACT